MRIITVNLTIDTLKEIKKYIGADKLFNSRTDFIRYTIRDLVLEELAKRKIESFEPLPIPIPEPINPAIIQLSDGTVYKLKEVSK